MSEEKREPKAYEFWNHKYRGTAWLEPNQRYNRILVARTGGGWKFDARQAEDETIKSACWNIFHEDIARELVRPSTQSEIDAWIAEYGKPAKYNPEAAIAAKKGTMNTKITPPDPLAKHIAAADDQAKGLRERQAKAQAVKANAEAGKQLKDELAALVAKYPIPGDKVYTKLYKPGKRARK